MTFHISVFSVCDVNPLSEPFQIILSPQGHSGLHTCLKRYSVSYGRFSGLLWDVELKVCMWYCSGSEKC